MPANRGGIGLSPDSVPDKENCQRAQQSQDALSRLRGLSCRKPVDIALQQCYRCETAFVLAAREDVRQPARWDHRQFYCYSLLQRTEDGQYG